MHLDKKILFLFCSITFIGNIYPAGVRFAEKYESNAGIDKYLNGNVKSISIDNRFLVATKWNERVIDGTVTHLSNGLFIYENNIYKYLVYNEYFNDNILSDIKLNENTTILTMELGQEFSIMNSNNSIIVETNSKWGFKNTLELEYDKNTHRLIKLNDDRENPQFSYFYEYEYNESGRLEFVYRIYNNDKVLIKSIYYDGQYRIIPHPYIYDIHTAADREIIVYQNNVIKYYIETHPQDSDHASSDILEKEEARYGLLTIEYDEYGNEIKQTLVREKSQYFDEYIQLYEIQNVELDQKMNWVEQKVFWVIYGEHRLIGTYSRNIKYE